MSNLLGLCLLLAVAYPILAAVVDWTVRGEALGVGGLEAIPAQGERRRRVVAVAAPALAPFAAMPGCLSGPRPKRLAGRVAA